MQKEDHKHTWMAMIMSNRACEDHAIFMGTDGECETEPVMATKMSEKEG